MSEVDKHYGATVAGRPGPASPAGRDEPGRTERRPNPKSVASAAASKLGSVRDSVGSAVDRAGDWAQDAYEDASHRATYARRRSVAQLNRGRRQVSSLVDENPIMIGVAGLAAGLLLGVLLPGTRKEDQVFGRYADEARRQGFRYAQDVAEQGRQLVEDNIQGLREAATRVTEDGRDA